MSRWEMIRASTSIFKESELRIELSTERNTLVIAVTSFIWFDEELLRV